MQVTNLQSPVFKHVTEFYNAKSKNDFMHTFLSTTQTVCTSLLLTEWALLAITPTHTQTTQD